MGCADTYCGEWQSPSLHVLLFVEFLVFCVFVVIIGVLTTVPAFDDWLRLNDVTSAGDLILVIIWLLGVIILITVYAPYQQQMTPRWYQILSLVLYVGYSLIVAILWFADDDTIGDAFKAKSIYWDQFSVGCTMSGAVLAWLLPYVTGAIYVEIGWQLVDFHSHGTWTGYQTVNLFCSVIVLTLVFFVWYFIGKYSGNIKEFPAISSRNMFGQSANESNVKKWCCQDCLFRCWSGHCNWWIYCVYHCNCCAECYKNTIAATMKTRSQRNNNSGGDNSNNDVDLNLGIPSVSAASNTATPNQGPLGSVELQTRNQMDLAAEQVFNFKNLNEKEKHLASASRICHAYGHGGSTTATRILGGPAGDDEVFDDDDDDDDDARDEKEEQEEKAEIKVDIGDNKTRDAREDDGFGLIEAIRDIEILSGDQQWRMINAASSTLFAGQIESSITRTKDKYDRLARENRLYKQIRLAKNEYMKYDARYLELNTIPPADLDVPAGVSKAQERDRVTSYVHKQLKEIIASGVHGKARGAGRAFTNVVNPKGRDGIRIDLSKQGFRNANKNDLIDETLLTQEARDEVKEGNLVLVEGGCFIGDIADTYWPPEQYSSLTDSSGKPFKVLPTRGGYKWLSLTGLSSVGGMGYARFNEKDGCNIADIGSSIVSLRLVTVECGEIKTYQIEPKTGAKVKVHNEIAKNALKEEGITLIEDNQDFSDVRTSVGTYGVITHAYVTLEDAYYLEITREKIAYSDWETKFQEYANDDSIHIFKLFCNPYHVSKITPSAMLATIFRKSDGPPNTPAQIKEWGGATNGSVALEIMELTGYTLQLAANGGFWEAVAAGLDISLNSLRYTSPNKKLIMSCIEAVDLGVTNGVPTQTNGLAFDVRKTVETVNGYVDFLRKQVKNGIFEQNLCITAPFAIRFCKQSMGSIGCAGEYDVGWIEQPIIVVGNNNWITQGGYDIANRNAKKLLKRTQEYLFANFEAKLHWGLWFPNNKAMSKKYPWWMNISNKNKNSFQKNYNRFNKDGVFSNVFTARLGLDGTVAQKEIEDFVLKEKFYKKSFEIIERLEQLIKFTSILFLLLCFPSFMYSFSFNVCLMLGSIYPYEIDFFMYQIECIALIIPLIYTKLLENDNKNANYWIYHCVAALVFGIWQFVGIFLHADDGADFDKYKLFEVIDDDNIEEVEYDCDDNNNGFESIYYIFVANLFLPMLMFVQSYFALKLHMYLTQKKQCLCFNYKCMA